MKLQFQTDKNAEQSSLDRAVDNRLKLDFEPYYLKDAERAAMSLTPVERHGYVSDNLATLVRVTQERLYPALVALWKNDYQGVPMPKRLADIYNGIKFTGQGERTFTDKMSTDDAFILRNAITAQGGFVMVEARGDFVTIRFNKKGKSLMPPTVQ